MLKEYTEKYSTSIYTNIWYIAEQSNSLTYNTIHHSSVEWIISNTIYYIRIQWNRLQYSTIPYNAIQYKQYILCNEL